ncbi:MAG: transglycosylase SLT domain-containing protein [Sporocytophaga sp.]|nr:transglycosylase SLT domain-containing protein [Sporocytophaga sp.]
MAGQIKVPMIAQSFYKTTELPLVQKKVDKILSDYGGIISATASLTNLPKELIVSFIFIESAGNPNAKSHAGAIGLMQLKPESANDMIYLENSKGRLSAGEKNLLRKTLGTRLDCILKMKYLGHKLPCNNNKGVVVTEKDLFNPEFNILAGSIYLGILADQHSENGTIRLDKVVYRYNKGYYAKLKDDTVEKIVATANEETKGYILKLAGKNGLLDLII